MKHGILILPAITMVTVVLLQFAAAATLSGSWMRRVAFGLALLEVGIIIFLLAL